MFWIKYEFACPCKGCPAMLECFILNCFMKIPNDSVCHCASTLSTRITYTFKKYTSGHPLKKVHLNTYRLHITRVDWVHLGHVYRWNTLKNNFLLHTSTLVFFLIVGNLTGVRLHTPKTLAKKIPLFYFIKIVILLCDFFMIVKHKIRKKLISLQTLLSVLKIDIYYDIVPCKVFAKSREMCEYASGVQLRRKIAQLYFIMFAING